MTNGEKVKEIFPDTKIITQYDNPFGDRFMVFTLNNEDMQVNIDWWNAEYKEPTTKNETLVSLEAYKQVAWERDIAIQQLHELGYEFGQKIEPTTKIDYRRAFKIACELLNGDVLYGVDADDIYELMMKKDGVVSSSSYEEYILNHLQELDQGQYASEPTTKNNLPYCQHTDEEIAKSFIEDVEAVKDQLPCGQMMDFPKSFDEFAKDYGFRDKKEIYTNGSELIPVFRVKQWLEHIATTKNDLAVDCISRQAVLDLIADYDLSMGQVVRGIHALPSVTPQEPKIKVLERDEAMRKLGAVDIYQARAWITLLNDLEYLKLKICEVEE